MKPIYLLLLFFLLSLDSYTQRLYWSQEFPPVIKHANVDGTDPQEFFIDGGGIVHGLGIDPIHHQLYYTVRSSSVADSRIGRCNMDGTEGEVLLSEVGEFLDDIALDVGRNKMYWVEGDLTFKQIMRANLDGSEPELVLDIDGSFTEYELELDIQQEKIYLWNPKSGDLMRVNFDGSDLETLISAPCCTESYPGLAIHPTTQKLYYVVFNDFNGNASLVRMDLDGTNEEVLISPSFNDNFYDLVIDTLNQSVYMLNIGKVASTGVNGGDHGNIWNLSPGVGEERGLSIYYGDLTSDKEVLQKESKIQIYPNPSSGQVFFQFSGRSTDMLQSIKVYDTFGKQVLTPDFSIANSSIDLSHLAKGIYHIVFEWRDGYRDSQRVVLQ